MATYSTNTDLILDTGKSLDEFFEASLTPAEIITAKDRARERAYNYINDRYLRGKSAIPATNIDILEQVEVDLVIADLMNGAFCMQTANTSDWAEKYKARAEDVLKELKIPASNEDPTVNAENTGNGTLTVSALNDMFTKTEIWILTAQAADRFSVRGTISGLFSELTVGTIYPEKDWSPSAGDYGLNPNVSPKFEEYPFTLLVTAGAIAFVQNDKFIFRTFASSYFGGQAGVSGNLVRA